MLVDGLVAMGPGVAFRRVVRVAEVVVGFAPFLCDGAPVGAGGDGAEGGGQGCGGRVEALGGAGLERCRYCKSPIDDGAEDVREERFGG